MDIILHSEDEPNKVQIRFRADSFLHSFVVMCSQRKQNNNHYANIEIETTGGKIFVFAVDEWQYNEFNDQMNEYKKKREF